MTSRLAELPAGVTDFAPETILIQPETALPRGLDISCGSFCAGIWSALMPGC
jgi:hypothetical protein